MEPWKCWELQGVLSRHVIPGRISEVWAGSRLCGKTAVLEQLKQAGM